MKKNSLLLLVIGTLAGLAALPAQADHHVGPPTAWACAPGGGIVGAGADADRDGVQNGSDLCPATPAGSRAGVDGCAMGEVSGYCAGGRAVTAMPKPKPMTAARDADGDGVEDVDDACPGTARDVEVDADGCAIIEKVVLKGVNFASGSAVLKSSAHNVLRSIAATMKGNEDIMIEVGGHTDSQGTEENNEKLSRRRADSVREFLIKEGIAGDRIMAKGYGESQPIDSNDTTAGKANNRRVEFKVTDD